MPTRDMKTPHIFLVVNFSTRPIMPKSKVQMPLVELSIVVLATEVNCRQANAK